MYLGLLEEFEEVNDNEYYITFDAILKTDMIKVLGKTKESLLDVDTFNIEMKLPKEHNIKLDGKLPQQGWYEIKKGGKEGLPAYIYSETKTIQLYVTEIKKVN